MKSYKCSQTIYQYYYNGEKRLVILQPEKEIDHEILIKMQYVITWEM